MNRSTHTWLFALVAAHSILYHVKLFAQVKHRHQFRRWFDIMCCRASRVARVLMCSLRIWLRWRRAWARFVIAIRNHRPPSPCATAQPIGRWRQRRVVVAASRRHGCVAMPEWKYSLFWCNFRDQIEFFVVGLLFVWFSIGVDASERVVFGMFSCLCSERVCSAWQSHQVGQKDPKKYNAKMISLHFNLVYFIIFLSMLWQKALMFTFIIYLRFHNFQVKNNFALKFHFLVSNFVFNFKFSIFNYYIISDFHLQLSLPYNFCPTALFALQFLPLQFLPYSPYIISDFHLQLFLPYNLKILICERYAYSKKLTVEDEWFVCVEIWKLDFKKYGSEFSQMSTYFIRLTALA